MPCKGGDAMKLIAKKPCSFGGRQFFIGNEIPAELVADPVTQEGLGVITIADTDNGGKTDGQPDAPAGQVYTEEQVEKMLAEAVDEAVNNTIAEMEQKQDELQQAAAELKEMGPDLYQGTVQISVKGASDGENGQVMAVPAKPEEITQVFSVMQMKAEEGAKAIAEIQSENVLILLHAADSRKTIKDAAKKRADNLFPAEGVSNGSGGDNGSTGGNTEGADA